MKLSSNALALASRHARRSQDNDRRALVIVRVAWRLKIWIPMKPGMADGIAVMFALLWLLLVLTLLVSC